MKAAFAFEVAAGLFTLGLVADGISRGRAWAIWLFVGPALLANGAALALRYWHAWPMLPMYLTPVALPFCLASLALLDRPQAQQPWVRRGVLALTTLVAWFAVLFPKDFYLPFLKSQSLFAHAFLLFGVLGRGCLLTGAIWAAAGVWHDRRIPQGGATALLDRASRWTVWGFAFWTLSLFAGELWSYLGWGTPVVWHDASITTTLATWFYYTALLHLHLTGSWTPRGRGAFAAAGVLVVLGLNWYPELGPHRWPFST
jgi:ABC-type transport system involved in cytochrome c biogenesis permease subunit